MDSVAAQYDAIRATQLDIQQQQQQQGQQVTLLVGTEVEIVDSNATVVSGVTFNPTTNNESTTTKSTSTNNALIALQLNASNSHSADAAEDLDTFIDTTDANIPAPFLSRLSTRHLSTNQFAQLSTRQMSMRHGLEKTSSSTTLLSPQRSERFTTSHTNNSSRATSFRSDITSPREPHTSALSRNNSAALISLPPVSARSDDTAQTHSTRHTINTNNTNNTTTTGTTITLNKVADNSASIERATSKRDFLVRLNSTRSTSTFGMSSVALATATVNGASSIPSSSSTTTTTTKATHTGGDAAHGNTERSVSSRLFPLIGRGMMGSVGMEEVRQPIIGKLRETDDEVTYYR